MAVLISRFIFFNAIYILLSVNLNLKHPVFLNSYLQFNNSMIILVVIIIKMHFLILPNKVQPIINSIVTSFNHEKNY